MKKIVVALGGNAILQPGQNGDYETQLANVEKSCKVLVKLIKDGYKLIITHGNGPQVGNLLRQNEEAKSIVPQMPLDVLTAETQGFIGYMIEQSLINQLRDLSIEKNVVNLLTRVEVSKDDEGFDNPSKPIGSFFTEEDAKFLMKEKGWNLKEDSNRGWRRVVASPNPISILEKDIIKNLVDNDTIVIACGGGGIPVVLENGIHVGVEAVIDKDRSGYRLAEEVDADIFMILTDVDNVYINYGKSDEKALRNVSIEDIEKYIEDGQFAKGSMGPKVEAALEFAKKGKASYITSLENADKALVGEIGTKITG